MALIEERAAASRALNADLHCHSAVSDGTLEPHALVERAHANGVDLFALTDHDEVAGIAPALARARELGLPFVAGVEISVTWADDTIHVVGLRIDANDEALLAGLARTRTGRRARALEIAAQLAAAGIPGAFEGALAHAGNPDLISRSHFARHIVDTGRCATVGEVFGRYLVSGKPGYVPHRWARLDEALGWIRGAGGIAVLAHPGRYALSPLAFEALLDAFVSGGGTGIEVVCGSHSPDQYPHYEAVARRRGLRASRGSDFHGPGESRHDLGSLPSSPAGLDPVWSDWPEARAALEASAGPR
jgi:3',5'-nucleoside bisphosphate phosphatase